MKRLFNPWQDFSDSALLSVYQREIAKLRAELEANKRVRRKTALRIRTRLSILL